MGIVVLAVIVLVPQYVRAAGWVKVERKAVQVRSAKGKASFSYTFFYPKKWRYVKAGASSIALPPGKRHTAFAVKLIHKGDSGPEQLLNRAGGFKKWIAKVQPGMKVRKKLFLPAAGKKRKVFYLKGKQSGQTFAFYALLIRAGNVNVVVLAGGPQADWSRAAAKFRQMMARLKIK
jgi:hypothetical protein